jgi:LysM repeat protein
MKAMRELLIGMLTAIASIVIVMGGITLSLAQGQPVALFPTVVLPTNTLPAPPTAVIGFPSPTVLSGFNLAETATLSPAPSITSTEIVPTNCPPPRGWQQYVIPSGVDLNGLASTRGTTVSRLMEANCLVSQDLMPDIILYVPPLKPTREPTHTQPQDTDTPEPTLTTARVTPVPCGHPHGWGIYYAQYGDTLYHIGMIFNTTITELQQANCLGNSTYIYVGQQLYVPVPPTRTPTEIPTQAPPTPHKTNTRTATNIPIFSIATTHTPIPTRTPAPTETHSPVPTHTPTLTPTPTLIPTNTYTFTPTSAPTSTPTSTPTDTLIP